MAKTHCFIHFYDEKVGEFMYKCEGIPKMPPNSENINWSCKSDSKIEKSFKVSYSNTVRDRAISNLLMLGYAPKNTELAQKGNNLSKNSSFYNSEKDAYILPKRPLEYFV